MPALVQGSLNQMPDEPPGSHDNNTHASTQPVRCKKGEENSLTFFLKSAKEIKYH